MAKTVFKSAELVVVPERIMINTPAIFSDFSVTVPREEEGETIQVVDEYTGPTAEELRQEAEEFKERWKIEKESMIQAAEAEANEITQRAEMSAARIKEQAAEDAGVLKSQAMEESEKALTEAQQKAQDIEAEARRTIDDERKQALEQGREEGRVEGYAEGKAEVDRLIQRTQSVLEQAQNQRGEILVGTEREIIALVLLISRKVVKAISESHRDVIVANVQEALRKVRDKGDVIIRVNLADMKLATDHKKEFIQALEGVKTIQIMEDTSVDPGGCIIETDFGEIDARISSQLAELEARILEISPIKSKTKAAPLGKL
jgi:flagellar assembly protein FliH